AQGKCSFPWDGIGLAHKRQLRFHRAVFKTAIFTQRGPQKSIELLKISFRQPEVVLALAKMVHDLHERSNVQNPLE
ncbi:hypothetical protein R2O95_14205, partial [Faecalibacterium duncaniae]|nr:hypothetical protein [Faecalibacterium duncaniae]